MTGGSDDIRDDPHHVDDDLTVGDPLHGDEWGAATADALVDSEREPLALADDLSVADGWHVAVGACCEPAPEAGTPVDPSASLGWVEPGGTARTLPAFDTNGDGRADTVELDTNGDGGVDTWLVDTTGSGVGDTMFIDGDGDGLPDARMVDPTESGQWSAAVPLTDPAPASPAPAAPAPVSPAPVSPAPSDEPSTVDTITALTNWLERETDPLKKEQIQKLLDFFTENRLARPWVE
jgi:hypothetical protein